MSYSESGRGVPRELIGGIPGAAHPPFYMNEGNWDGNAGSSETVTTPYSLFYMLNCRGPDSTQRLNESVRVHMIEVTRVWFNLPLASTIPADNTLWLQFSVAGTAAYSNIHTARTIYDYVGVVTTDYQKTGDPTQEVGTLYPATVLVLPLGNAAPGDNVVVENKSRVQLIFPGASQGMRDLRVTVRTSDGNVYTDLNGQRVFVELFLWCEKRF